MVKVNTEVGDGKCPGCGGMWSLIGYRHRCSERLLQKEVPRADAEPAIRRPEASAHRERGGRTVGSIPATGASPVGGRKKQVYMNTDERREYMREYMRNRRAAKREK